MEANYVGPGWYWVENVDQPLFVEMGADGNLWASHNHIRFNLGRTAINITHIPRPAQRPIVDWSVMPAWAKWVAMDQDGRWMWYAYMPCQDEESGVWLGDDSVPLDALDGTLPEQCTPTYTGDWRNSLVERPE